jgi:hypothetical protein
VPGFDQVSAGIRGWPSVSMTRASKKQMPSLAAGGQVASDRAGAGLGHAARSRLTGPGPRAGVGLRFGEEGDDGAVPAFGRDGEYPADAGGVLGVTQRGVADGTLSAVGFGQRQVRLDLVAVAAAVFLLDDVAGPGQVGDDAVGAALGDAQAGRRAAGPPGRGRCTAAPGRGWSGRSSSPPGTC